MRIRTTVKLLGLAAGIAFAAAPLVAQDSPRVEIKTSVRHAVTPPLSSFVPFLHEKPNPPFRVFPLRKPVPPEAKGGKPGGNGHGGGGATWTDNDFVPPASGNNGTRGSVFDGIDNGCASLNGCVPPDPNLSVNSTQIVQTVNVEFAVWNKPSFGGTATLALAPAPIHTIFSSLGNSSLCSTVDGGDPIVLWDKFDNRWLISQFAYNSSLNNDHWCLAISKGSDAAHSGYDVYDFSFGSSFPDYPKLGIWLDGNNPSDPYSGVYFSDNTFAHGNRFTGAQACAFPLSEVSNPPTSAPFSMVCSQQSSSVYNILPADTDGPVGGPGGVGGLYLQFVGNGTGNTLNLYQFRPDFVTPTNSTFSLLHAIGVKTFHEACGGSSCIPQAGTSEQLDSLGDRLMYRLAYRNTAGMNTLFVNQSVQVSSSSNQTGVRWYAIQNPESSTPSVTEGTYSPDSNFYRWMGSIASDVNGNIGLAYSVSSSTTHPGLAFAGRVLGDSPGNALENEKPIYTGAGSQTGINRWGDYSSTAVDPADDCTFWYTNEYLQTNGSYTNWRTKIASFRFSGCTN